MLLISVTLPALATIVEVARYLQISEATLWRMLRDGKLPSVPFSDEPGSTIRIKALDVQAWVDRRTITGRPSVHPPSKRRGRGRPRKLTITAAN